jgi:hypothetical protein
MRLLELPERAGLDKLSDNVPEYPASLIILLQLFNSFALNIFFCDFSAMMLHPEPIGLDEPCRVLRMTLNGKAPTIQLHHNFDFTSAA